MPLRRAGALRERKLRKSALRAPPVQKRGETPFFQHKYLSGSCLTGPKSSTME
jgi:hypothetical protein